MIDQKIIDDFLRTKGDFVEQFASRFINNLLMVLDLKQKELDKKVEDSYVAVEPEKASIFTNFVDYRNGFMSLKGLDEESIWYALFREMHRILLDYDFEGESLPNVIKQIYKYNSGNDIGLYVEPLMEIIATSESRQFVPTHKAFELEFIDFKKPRDFFGSSIGVATCRIKPAPFVMDFISALEKKSQSTDYKFELFQIVPIDSSRTKTLPLYDEFKYETWRKNESEIKSEIDKEIKGHTTFMSVSVGLIFSIGISLKHI